MSYETPTLTDTARVEDWITDFDLFEAADRDPEVFDQSDDVIWGPDHNRHVAFGSGIHRGVESILARMELRDALQVWLDRMPDFSLADPAKVTWAGGQVRGPRPVPVIVHRSTSRA